MKKKIIFLFGASGFVGRNLVQTLECDEIIGIDKMPVDIKIKKKIRKFYQNDILQLSSDIFPDKYFYVINLIAELGSASPELNYLNNLESAKKIISLLGCKKKYCKGIIHFSSISAVRAVSHYGETKKASEDVFLKSGYKVVILRSEMIIGSGARSIEKFTKALKIFPFFTFLPDGGYVKRFPIDITEVGKIVNLIIQFNYFKNKIYYLVSAPVLVREIAKKITKRIIIPIPKQLLFILAKILERFFKKPFFTYDNAVGICTDTKFDGEIISEDVIRENG